MSQDLRGGMCGRWLHHASGLHQGGLGEWQREVRLLSAKLQKASKNHQTAATQKWFMDVYGSTL